MAFLLVLLCPLVFSQNVPMRRPLDIPKQCMLFSCQLRPPGEAPLSLSYRIYEEGVGTYVDLKLNGDTFSLIVETISFDHVRLPFELWETGGGTFYRLADSGDAHYFVRDGGRFFHLGRLPPLHFDADENLFFTLRGYQGMPYADYYALEGDSLRYLYALAVDAPSPF